MTRRKRKKLQEIETFTNVLQNPENMKGKWASKYFGNDNPIVLELGCGKGEYTVSLARRFPNKNFIGVDIKGARLWKGAGICLDENIANAAFLRIPIEDIESHFEKGEVTEIWITFPDPYPKQSKENKRLVSPRFLRLYRNVLVHGGHIHFKTDNHQLFEYGLKTLEEEHCEIVNRTWNLYKSDLLNDLTTIKTYYENKFLTEGITIKYAEFKLNGKNKELPVESIPAGRGNPPSSLASP